MAQEDYTIDNASGATVRADINSTLAAIVSQNSGAAAPSTTFANMVWVDETNDLMKIRNAANSGWVTVASWDGTTWVPYSGGSALTYAEGSWTPVIAGATTAGAQTYSVQVGRYIRIGNLVHAWFTLAITAKDAATAGALQISGLPFTSSNIASANQAGSVGYHSGIDLTTNYVQVGVFVPPNATIVSVYQSGDNQAQASMDASALTNSTTIGGYVAYRIN